jgi:hypothetical protein
MQVRSKLRHLNPGDRVSISELWSRGRESMDLAYNDVTARPLTNVFELDDPTMVFFFVGGRSSLFRFFSNRENYRLFLPAKGDELGLVIERSRKFMQTDKTMIGVCNVGLRSVYEVTPIQDFVNTEGVQVVNTHGARMDSAQLASIIYSLYLDPKKKKRDLDTVMQGTGIRWK